MGAGLSLAAALTILGFSQMKTVRMAGSSGSNMLLR